MIKVNAVGQTCPIPIIMTKNALKDIEEGEVEVLVDNKISLENLQKMSKEMGYDYSIAETGEVFRIVINKIKEEVEEFDDAVRVVAKNRLRSTQVKTLPYPGYPTDMQPQIGVVLALAQGTSTITESIFENRFKYLDELARMGAVIKVEGNSATIEGVEKYSGARVSAPDLRAGAALCIAGLATDGITIVDDIVYIQRGYERFEEKLRGLGGIIEKVSDEKEIQKFKLKVG